MIFSSLTWISSEMGILIKVACKKVTNLVDDIRQSATELIMGSEKIVISSGKNFDKEWIRFRKELVKKLNHLNIKKKTENLILNSKLNGLEEVLNNNFSKMFKIVECSMRQKIMHMMGLMAKSELEQILINLRGENFFNLSGNPIDKSVLEQLKYGKKYTPFCALNIRKEKRLFETELCAIVNRIFGKEAANIKTNHLFIKLRKLKKNRLIKKNSELSKLLKSIETECKIGQKKFLESLRKEKRSNRKVITDQKLDKIFQLNQDQILIAADKNVGYVCMDKDDLLKQYKEINEKQHFGKVNIREEWYIKNIFNFLEEAKENIPFELTNIIKQEDFKWKEGKQEIGNLRLMPKILKLKQVSKSNVGNLTCRGIKSSMNDPIKLIQKVLDKVYSHLLHDIELEFWRLFGKLSPSVTGIDEAIKRVKDSKTGEWGNSIEFEGDFGDLYSNCNKELLEQCLIKASKIGKLDQTSTEYILKLMNVSMSHSYFKEPEGIFKTLNGFSMGDNSAARGSEIILRIYELEIYRKIYKSKLDINVNRYLRFRDDVSVHLTGKLQKMLKVIKIIITGYPKCIQFNVESRVVYGKFLNIKIFNIPGEKHPTTTILRKPNSKFDIIPFNSNVSNKYKKMAGLGYYKTIKTHTCTEEEKVQQLNIVRTILTEKGFPKSVITELEKHENINEKEDIKRFIGTTVFDNVSKRHKIIKSIIKKSELSQEKFYLPADIPGKKLEQYIFSIRKMKEKLNF